MATKVWRGLWNHLGSVVNGLVWSLMSGRCQVSKGAQPAACSFIRHLLASQPNEILTMDYMGFEPTYNGTENILAKTDVFSKYCTCLLF